MIPQRRSIIKLIPNIRGFGRWKTPSEEPRKKTTRARKEGILA